MSLVPKQRDIARYGIALSGQGWTHRPIDWMKGGNLLDLAQIRDERVWWPIKSEILPCKFINDHLTWSLVSFCVARIADELFVFQKKTDCSCIENYSFPYISIILYEGDQYCSLCFFDNTQELCLAWSWFLVLPWRRDLGADGWER